MKKKKLKLGIVRVARSLTSVMLALAPSANYASNYASIDFSLDQPQTNLSIEITSPSIENNKNIAVILVPGSGLNDRDYDFGISGSQDALIFKSMSHALVSGGYTVVRYDEPPQLSFGSSYNESKATALNKALIYSKSNLAPAINCLIAISFSEGIYTLSSSSVDTNNPDAILAISAPLQTKADVLDWQLTERPLKAILSMDRNGDERISLAELQAGWRTTPLWMLPLPRYLIRDGYVDPNALARLRTALEFTYTRLKNQPDNFTKIDGLAVPGEIIRSWINDRNDPRTGLNELKIPISLIWGQDDGQLDIASQLSKSLGLISRVNPPRLVSGVGHTLGKHQLLGPIGQTGMKILLSELHKLEKVVPSCVGT